jgi:hypothetical protein
MIHRLLKNRYRDFVPMKEGFAAGLLKHPSSLRQLYQKPFRASVFGYQMKVSVHQCQ